jgi:xanthine dehydrogenase accessory factor
MTVAQRGGLLGLLDALQGTRARSEPWVLGIIFATTGSTYQKPGVMVLLDREGLRHGVISGGCLEPELEDRARQVLQNGRAETIDFDMRTDEDITFGSGTGCRGRIRLLLLPQQNDAPLSDALMSLADGEEAVDIAIDVAGEHIGSGVASLRDRRWNWNSDGRVTNAESRGDTSNVARLVIEPPPRVLLLGSGAESVPLQEFLRQLGWKSIVVEHRGRWLDFAQRAGADEIVEHAPESAVPVWRNRRIDAAIAMSHNFGIDLKNLALCAETDIGYIGLLGPAARRDALLADLGAATASRLRDRLHAPVGLALGGSGPDAIALSIVAELQSYFARREPGES